MPSPLGKVPPQGADEVRTFVKQKCIAAGNLYCEACGKGCENIGQWKKGIRTMRTMPNRAYKTAKTITAFPLTMALPSFRQWL